MTKIKFTVQEKAKVLDAFLGALNKEYTRYESTAAKYAVLIKNLRMLENMPMDFSEKPKPKKKKKNLTKKRKADVLSEAKSEDEVEVKKEV